MLSTVLANKMGKRQVTYQKATQDRLNFTSDVLGSIKAVKMLGYGSRFTESMRHKRLHDLNTGNAFRIFTVWLNVIGKPMPVSVPSAALTTSKQTAMILLHRLPRLACMLLSPR